MAYDEARLANFGRDAAQRYGALVKSNEKLKAEINAALAEGVKPIKITHDVLGRCPTHSAKINLMTVLIALSEMGHIPKSIVEPFKAGVQSKRL